MQQDPTVPCTGLDGPVAAATSSSGRVGAVRTCRAPSAAAEVRSAAAATFACCGKSSLPSSRRVVLANSNGQNGIVLVEGDEVRGGTGLHPRPLARPAHGPDDGGPTPGRELDERRSGLI